ncbi:MAG: hypothetical protein HYT80_11075 [Euryarchaeota archaeon]|nr:hypothetical protein [Euryarchaeota archaeon]
MFETMEDPNVRFRRRMSMPNLDAGATPASAEVTDRLFRELPDTPPHDALGVIDPREAFRPVWAPGGSAVALLSARLAAALVLAWSVMTYNPITNPTAFGDWARTAAADHPIAMYRAFVEGSILPSVDLWAWLSFVVEAALALALAAGILVGLTGFLATVWAGLMALGTWGFAAPRPGGGLVYAPDYLAVLLIAVPFVAWLTRAGRYYGFDGLVRPFMLGSRSKGLQWIAARLM